MRGRVNDWGTERNPDQLTLKRIIRREDGQLASGESENGEREEREFVAGEERGSAMESERGALAEKMEG
jgi:hypothetical protein